MEIVEWKDRRKNRGITDSGLTHECGVFGAIGNKHWPCNSEIAQFICIGLEALQHRYVYIYIYSLKSFKHYF